MKLELGGGIHPRGDGFLNMDMLDVADIRHNLDEFPWPVESNRVDELYSSHCLEHLVHKHEALYEIARVCRVGASVVIRLPHPMGEMAMVHGHQGVIGEVDLLNNLQHFPDECWKGDKILRLLSVEQRADATWFHRARKCHLFADWTDEEILTWVPRTAHENEFRLEVVER